jgi:hypothetical protein
MRSNYIDRDWNIINDANLELLTQIKFSVGKVKEEIYKRKFNVKRKCKTDTDAWL